MTDPKPNTTADSFMCGHGITLGGKRFLVTSVTYYQDGNDAPLDINLQAMPYKLCEPCLYAFDVPKPKVKRKRKAKRARKVKARKTKVKRKSK